jgi:hypothetical protein
MIGRKVADKESTVKKSMFGGLSPAERGANGADPFQGLLIRPSLSILALMVRL